MYKIVGSKWDTRKNTLKSEFVLQHKYHLENEQEKCIFPLPIFSLSDRLSELMIIAL